MKMYVVMEWFNDNNELIKAFADRDKAIECAKDRAKYVRGTVEGTKNNEDYYICKNNYVVTVEPVEFEK